MSYRFFPVLRRRTMNLSLALFFALVRPSGFPFQVDGVTSTGSLTFTTTMRVVDQVHRDTADGWAHALQRIRPALPQLMLDCSALPTAPTWRGNEEGQRCGFRRMAVQLGVRDRPLATSWTLAPARRILAPPPWAKLDRVHDGTGRDVAQWQVVPRLDVGLGASLNPVAL